MINEEKMMDKKLGPLDLKRSRKANYNVDDEDSDVRSQPNLKKSRRYIIVLDSESVLGEREDDKDKDPNYVP